MISFVVGFALLLHVFFWGTGLAMLAMPRPWRRFWPVLVFPAGFALQSFVVWLGAYAGLHGTNSYAWGAELVPALLLAVGVWRLGVHHARLDLGRFGLVWATVGAALALLILPLAVAARGLTTTSLGSCDAADYAAGARVFMEFARTDRTGFLGLTEVVRVMSADNFYDFWLRLNHFTPSALMALNGSILQCPPHELASVLTMVVLAAAIPVVFWMARALFGYSGAASLVIAAVYGVSPITWYSVAHVSPAPLLAAAAIALLNWTGIALWRGRLTWRRGLAFAGVLMVAYALILGSYNFILLVALVPALAYVGLQMLVTLAWARLARWLLVLLTPLVVTGLVFWDRVAGLIERFQLFQTYDFGWRIPALLPEGWLGMVQGADLEPWNFLGLRWLLATIVVVALGFAVQRAVATKARRIWLVAAVTVPVLAGYAYLEIRGAVRGTNASYDAFKLFTVFYPMMLPAFCWWITLRWSSRLVEWFAVAAFAAVVVGFNVIACGMSLWRLSRPPLIVDGELRQLRRIETMSDVGSVNLLVPDMWSRLWANAFLLHKLQYFQTHTYEGRLNTPLRGDWDLNTSVVREQPAGAGARQVTPHAWLLDTRALDFVRAEPGDGWYPEERLPDGDRWCWTRAGATVRMENPHAHPVTVVPVLDGRSLGKREVTLGVAGGPTPAAVAVPEDRRRVVFPPITLPPGKSTLVLRSPEAAARVTGDTRPLAVCVFSLVLQAR